MKKTIDYPPVWLAAFILVAIYTGPGWGHIATTTGWALVAAGLMLTVAAAFEFKKNETTIVPHETPARLIRTGVFQHSRNPIYLADVMILLGVALWTGSIVGLLLVPVFFVILERRFIRPEEARLSRAFGADFDAYKAETRRWL